MQLPHDDRVQQNTPEVINEEIRRRTFENVARIAKLGSHAIDDRLRQLEVEWDIERCFETVAPSLTLAGTVLGLTVSPKWFMLPIFVQSFLLQHAIQGWCPPLPVLRRLGIRTTGEIDVERNALKAIRGDYRQVIGQNGQGAFQAFAAAQH